MTVDEVTLAERADAAFAGGQSDEALRLYLRLLRAAPLGNLHAWYRTAILLARLGERGAAAQSLDLVTARLVAAGQLLPALASVKALAELDPALARVRVQELAQVFGAGSPRLDRQRRAAPPPVPDQLAAEDPEVDRVRELRVLRELAVDACEAAGRKARAQPEEQVHGVAFHPLFSDLAPADLEALLPLIELRACAAGERVIEQGSEGKSLFVVVRGQVRVMLRAEAGELELAILRAGAFFGEMALLTNSPRLAAVICERPTLLVELGRAQLEELAGRNARIAGVLANHTRQRLLRNLMATSPLFAPLDQPRRERLVSLFESQLFGPGEDVITEGQPGGGLHVVLSGGVQVLRAEQGGELLLAELGPGQIFGEISLIQQRPATATVRAAGKSVLLSLPRSVFDEHVSEFPEVVAHVYRVAVEREKANREIEAAQLVPVEESLLLI